MMKNEIKLIEKVFNDKQVRTIWNPNEEKFYLSIVDIINLLIDSKDVSGYWRKLKQRLKNEGNESVTNCHGLKMISKDGKYRMTDVVDIEGMFRLIESIPSKKAEPVKLWLARLGKERIDEEYDPEITINRALETYKRKGYSDDWINQRLKAIDIRNEFTNELKNKGINKIEEFATLTNILTKIWSGYTVGGYKQYKGLKKENLRDNMTNMELVLNMLAEVSSTEISKNSQESGYKCALDSVKKGGRIAFNAKE